MKKIIIVFLISIVFLFSTGCAYTPVRHGYGGIYGYNTVYTAYQPRYYGFYNQPVMFFDPVVSGMATGLASFLLLDALWGHRHYHY